MYAAGKNVFGKSKQMCYDNKEVKSMNNEHLELPEEKRGPRPAWQVWLARIGLVLFVIAVALCYIHLFRSV